MIDTDLTTRWEQLLQSLPEVEQVVVLARDEMAEPRRLHVADVLPQRGVFGAASPMPAQNMAITQ